MGCATPPVPSQAQAYGFRTRTPGQCRTFTQNYLGEGDVTLLGDAAHAQLPALGLGVSTALGDIEELIAQVQSCTCSK